MLRIKEADIYNWDNLPAEVVQELLTVEFNEDTFGENESDSDKFTKSDTYPFVPDKSASGEFLVSIWEKIVQQFELSDFGKKNIKQLIAKYVENGNKDHVAKYFSINCLQSQKYFEENLLSEIATKNLLKIINLICSAEKNVEISQTAGISGFENNAIQYLGGFVLRKIKSKFSESSSLLPFLSDSSSQGNLIKIMEKKQGSLFCPDENFLSLLHTVYLLCSRESFKQPNLIDFKRVDMAVQGHPHYQAFQEQLYEKQLELTHETVQKILKDAISLFIKVLSYTLAKQLFHNIFKKPTKQAKTLRSSLK